MTDAHENDFAARIRERYPEGLTGIFAVGGTRTTYILEKNRHAADPGRIGDFAAQGEYLLPRYWALIQNFFELGGQNMILPVFSFRGFYNRGDEYADLIAQEMPRFINEASIAFYQEHEVDPSFIGVDTLLLMPPESATYKVGQQFLDFQTAWPYRAGRRRLIWELASIPFLTFWRLFQSMTEAERAALDEQITAQDNLEAVYHLFYARFSQAIYGLDVPPPHFYLGTNKSGDLKIRAPLPIALTGGEYLRMFYTPYPSLFTTRDTLQTILEDLAFGTRFYSAKTDYSGQYTAERVHAEYDRVTQLSHDPQTTLGLSRRVE